MGKNIYISLDEARKEIKKRWDNVELRKKIEEELGEKFIPIFKKFPLGVSFRQICSPDNGFTFFYQCAKYVGTEPLALEYHNDIFVSFNEEKKGLGRLRVTLNDGMKATIDIMDFHAAEKKSLKEIKIYTGESLIDFHRNLFKISGFNIDIYDKSKWLQNIGKAKDYYYPLLLHYIAHGVLFETFSLDPREKGEAEFVNNVIIENINKIEVNFNLKPMIIRSYPENQTDDEDFYWWSYPPDLNKHLINYMKENNLNFKKC